MESDEQQLPAHSNKVKYFDVEYAEGCSNVNFASGPVLNGHLQEDRDPAPSQTVDVP